MEGQVAGRRKLVLCFDGTMNAAEHQTNIARIFRAIPDSRSGFPSQLKFYSAGVGASRDTGMVAAFAGAGFDASVMEAYCWLVRHYHSAGHQRDAQGERFADGDEIYLFGFSRGAYAARQLAMLIDLCGVVRRERLAALQFGENNPSREQLRDITTRLVSCSGPALTLIQHAWSLFQRRQPTSGDLREGVEFRQFREQQSEAARVRFLGVFETVSRMGVRVGNVYVPGIESAQARVHRQCDRRLGRAVDNAFQALAIDEHRRHFEPSLWTHAFSPADQRIEQRWFVGSHGNVGGGLRGDRLPDVPLRWMAERAVECGLVFEPEAPANIPSDFQLTGSEIFSPVQDSFALFLRGGYRVMRFGRRHLRVIMQGGLNESVDTSAFLRMRLADDYRAANLIEAQGRVEASASRAQPFAAGVPGPSAGREATAGSNGMFWML